MPAHGWGICEEDSLLRIVEVTRQEPTELQAGQGVPAMAEVLTMGCAGRCGSGTWKGSISEIAHRRGN